MPAPDFIVIGGGVFGCATAYELARRGARVTLVDKSLPGRASSASAGGLWPLGEAVGLGCGVIYHNAQGDHESNGAGPEMLPDAFRAFLEASNDRFPQVADELLEQSGIDIEYRPGGGLLFLIYDEAEEAFVDRVARALPEGRLELLTAAEARRHEPALTTDLRGAALLPGEHQVNPMLLAEAYKKAAMRRGVEFLGDRQVTALRRQGDRVSGIETASGALSSGCVVNAAGAWAGKLAATAGLRLPVFPVRGQIVLTETLPPLLRCCLSTSQAYLAQKHHGEVLIGSTTERTGFDVSVTTDAIAGLCRGAARAVPALKQAQIKRIWAGLRPGTPDELPILGPVDGVAGYVNAAGGFRTGVVATPLTGRVVAQSALGETTDVPLEPFRLERFAEAERISEASAKPA